MGSRILVCLLFICINVLVMAAEADSNDYAGLEILKEFWENTPPSWIGSDPCGNGWEGITCTNSRVTSITLPSMGLTGQMPPDIQKLSELQILDLSYNKGLQGSLPPSIGNLKNLSTLILVGCSFTGPIPETIGLLQKLVYLTLNINGFSGKIPSTIGRLSNLYWLDLAENNLTGPLPVSNGSMPGLDMLVNTKHFHLGKNQLSGDIPSQLFTAKMSLKHLLLENNRLTGKIPSTLGLVQTLEVVRLDRNLLSGPIPSNLNNLTKVHELYLSNNKLNGSLPDLNGMNELNYVDISNNSFHASDVPLWFPTLRSLTTLIMESSQLQGPLPAEFFSIPRLQTVVLRNNHINGTLDFGSSYSKQLVLVDLQQNSITEFAQSGTYTVDSIILVSNPICTEDGTQKYCSIPEKSNPPYSTPPNNCAPIPCSSYQVSSPSCICAYPYTGILFFRSPSFSDLENPSNYIALQNSLLISFHSLQLPVESVTLSDPAKNLDDYLAMRLSIFPAGQNYFNRTGILGLGFVLSNQTFKPNGTFGPFYFNADGYNYFAGISGEKSCTGIIVGAAVGGSVLVLLLLLAGVYAFRQRRRAERAPKSKDPFASWDSNQCVGGVPQLKGARSFTFDELKKCTNNFSEANCIGSGGYGKVYQGALPNGQLVAIKRAQQGSMQGALEFKTEIELLSRVHHKNLVSLVGFCFGQQGEQMLVYEYIPNGTLKESLSGDSGIWLDWMRRLRIALGAARGLQYLHDLANPPIIHRDIKSNNILLDGRLNAKVADFGLSKDVGDAAKGHVTTQVKGTLGYLDPEYYMTQILTEKSDVYSFGVLLLELITARSPLDKGKYIVREVKLATDKTKDLYDLQAILDPVLVETVEQRSLEKWVDLAMKCLEETGAQRPVMSDVVKEIESIMELAGLKPNTESASTSASYEGRSRGSGHPYSNESLFA